MIFLFVIETNDLKYTAGDTHSRLITKEAAYSVEAASLEEACQKLHPKLVELDAESWTDSWEDLLYDVREGSQMCYGPFDEVSRI